MREPRRRGFARRGFALASLVLMAAAPGSAGTVRRAAFGSLADGQAVEKVTLANGRGISVSIITLGARIQSVIVPDRQGRPADVALGYDDVAGYAADPNYFGATVGRVANRIAHGRFALDDRDYQIPPNNGDNALHGGPAGFDKRVWSIVSATGGAAPEVRLRLVSPDGDQGFPGTLTVLASYRLDDTGALSVTYEATADRSTVVNLSQHAYWNLAGEGAAGGAMGHRLTIPADTFLPTDAGAIPTGEFRPVAGTPFDFRRPIAVADRLRDGRDAQLRIGRGYDHNWVVSRTPPAALQRMAFVEDPASGRTMEVLSNQPGVQFYSGNFLDGTTAGKHGHLYRQGDAVVLEAQMFPDTPNRPAFGSVRLAPGERYRNRIVFRFSQR